MASVDDKKATVNSRSGRPGLQFARIFTKAGIDPFSTVQWETRTAAIKDEKGSVIFEQTDCEFPVTWSQLATNVVASKYFYGENGTAEREKSVRQLVHRVSRTMTDWGVEDGYFASEADAQIFYDELTYLLVHQYASFNSPVWFNVGLYDQYGIEGPANNWRWDEETRTVVTADNAYKYPQGSACFIQSVSDDMNDIMRLATSEAMLFKYGSGTGTDLSTLRSSREKLSGGGRPSGPVSFMKVYDAIASVIKSGGKTRRAAKMQTLKVWHPDIMDFIQCKTKEERKAHALIRQGYDANFNGDAYSSVAFQNANLTVRATDGFLRAVENDESWTTRAVTTGKPVETMKANEVMQAIAEGTWQCGDPGMQYEDTIQRWHTCSNTAPINSSNPCSEFMFLDDTACNLASLNLMKFRLEDGTFDAERFRSACRVFITAQEILVDRASYPTDRIALNSHKFRPLGLGFANLGSLIMASGRPYDSDEGRDLAGAITSIMHGEAYRTSAEIAGIVGTFDGYALNREPMARVMQLHHDAVENIGPSCPRNLLNVARKLWDEVLDLGRRNGFRNSQVTVLAPTGTIAFMMDCDTTGVEPDIALVKYKSLAGRGMLKIVNRTVPMALRTLGYDEPTVEKIVDYIDKNDTIEGPSGLKPEHLPVFDCSFPPAGGGRSIHYRGHVKMMAAVQPFLSGAISKTVNMPNDANVTDIRNAYLEGWKMGLKALAIYRDGSKGSQPVSTSKDDSKTEVKAEAATVVAPAPTPAPVVSPQTLASPQPRRIRLPDTRQSMTHKFDIQGHEGYITVGFFENGQPGELFITMAKEGSTVGGLMDVIGTLVSMGLQYGVPLEVFIKKFAHGRYEPSGFTRNPDIPIAKSITDYIFRWLGIQFIPGYREANTPLREQPAEAAIEPSTNAPKAAPVAMAPAPVPAPPIPAPVSGGSVESASSRLEIVGTSAQQEQFANFQSDAPACDCCGSLTVRCGTCYRCFNCGNSMGCG
ncbi:MAG: vitamin B12-dependent ribonucleotide reductase [bacterium]